MDKLILSDIRAFLAKMKAVAAENKDHLIALDSKMGDGDLGLTMVAVFAAMDEFAAGYSGEDIGELLMKGGMSMSKAAPSTMGTLMATGFMRGGQALKGCTELGITEISKFWDAFVKGLMDRGKSKPGDKTIVDAIFPAAESFKVSAAAGDDIPGSAAKAKTAAETGRDNTMGMVAQHGRIAYYQEKSREIQDPGATMGAILVGTFADFIASLK